MFVLVPASTKDYQPTAGIAFFQHHASEFVKQTMRKVEFCREREGELSKVLNQLDLCGGSRRLVSHFWGSFCQNIMFLWCTFTRMPALSLFCFSCSHLVKIMIPTFDCMLYFLCFLCTSLHSVYSSGRTFLLFPMFYYWHKQHMRRHCGINSVSSCSQFMWGKRRLLYTLKGEAQSQQLSCILYSCKS